MPEHDLARAGGGAALGVDVGSVRVGVAIAPAGVRLAVPLETVPRDVDGGSDVRRIAELAAEHRAGAVVVGLPRTLAGAEGPAARAAREFGDALAGAGLPVTYADERLTTVVAHRQMRSAGRSARRSRPVVDQAAAAAILQGWLDAYR